MGEREQLNGAIALSEEAEATALLADATGDLAEAMLGQGRIDEAREAALRALALARQVGAADAAGETWQFLGQAVRAASTPIMIEGITYGADGCFAESLRVPREAGWEGQAAWTLWAWAEDLWAREERERAAAPWRAARDIFARLGMAQERAGMAGQPGDDGVTD